MWWRGIEVECFVAQVFNRVHRQRAAAVKSPTPESPDRAWFVYLLLCRGERIYCGVTPDLKRRIGAHRSGNGAKFTRIHPPERLLAVKTCAGKIGAMQLEAQIKRMRRAAKLALAEVWLLDQSVVEMNVAMSLRV